MRYIIALIFCTFFSLNAFTKVITLEAGTNKLSIDLSEGLASFTHDGKKMISNFVASYRLKGKKIQSSMYQKHSYEWLTKEHLVVQHTSSKFPNLEQHFVQHGEEFICYIKIKSLKGELLHSNFMSPIDTKGKACIDLHEGEECRIMLMPSVNRNSYRWRYPLVDATTAEEKGYYVTTIFDNDTRHGLVMGAITHDTWKSGILYQSKKGEGIINFTLASGIKAEYDVLPHGEVKGTEVSSAKFSIGYYNDYRQGLLQYANMNTEVVPRKINNASWDDNGVRTWKTWGPGSQKLDLTYEEILGTSDFLSTTNLAKEDFAIVIAGKTSVKNYKDFVQHTQGNKQITGGYFNPFKLSSIDMIDAKAFREGKKIYTYRELLIKDRKGKPVEITNLGGNKIMYVLDPTHPITKKRISAKITNKIKAGNRFLRLDFLFHGAVEGVYYDKNITTGAQAYYHGIEYIKSLVGDSIHINIAISPFFPYHFADSRRSSGDTYEYIESIAYQLNSLSGDWWMGNDNLFEYLQAGSLVFEGKKDIPQLSQSQINAKIVTSGFVMLSDDYLNPFMQENISKYLSKKSVLDALKLGKCFQPVEINSDSPNTFVHYQDKDHLYLAVFNFSKKASTESLALERLFNSDHHASKYSFTDIWTDKTFVHSSKEILKVALPPQGSKLYKLKVVH